MTDDDFDKVDEDFASEFDFVDNKEAGSGAPKGPSSPQQPQQPKGSSAIVTLMVIISILGAGYWAYNKFFAKKPEAVPVAQPPTVPEQPTTNAPGSAQLPTLPEHMSDALQQAANDTAAAPSTPSSVAEALNKPATEDISSALPPPANGEKTFEQLQKDLQTKAATPAQPAQPVVPQEVRNALQTISEDITENVNNIRQLEGTIGNISTTLDQLNRTISAMDNRILALTETVNGLSDDLTNVKRVMVEQDLDLTMPGNVKSSSSGGKKQLQSISSSEPNYNVHAIIPGRAWLKSANGQIITVTEGDKIGDYGSVAVIDAANGLVRTSSGIIIR